MPSNDPPQGRFQFGLATLLFMMVVVSVLASVFVGILRPTGGAVAMPRAFFVALAAATPLGFMTAVALFWYVTRWFRGRGRRD